MPVEDRVSKFKRLGKSLASVTFDDPLNGETGTTLAYGELRQVFTQPADLLAEYRDSGITPDDGESLFINIGLFTKTVESLEGGTLPAKFGPVLLAFETLTELAQKRFDQAVTKLAEHHSRSELKDQMSPDNLLRSIAAEVNAMSPNSTFRQLLRQFVPSEALLTENISIAARTRDAAKAIADQLELARKELGIERMRRG